MSASFTTTVRYLSIYLDLESTARAYIKNNGSGEEKVRRHIGMAKYAI